MSRPRGDRLSHRDPIMTEFHQIVEDSGLSFDRLGEVSGVHPQTIQNWGKCNPGVLNLQAVLNGMGHKLVIKKIGGPHDQD